MNEILKKLDLTDLAYRLSQMALKVISGKELETKEYELKVKLPADLVEPIIELAKATGLDANEMLSHLAAEGLSISIKNRLAQAQQTPLPEKNTESFLNMGQLTQGMEKMQQLAGKLQDLQRTLNVEPRDDNNTKNKENNRKSTIPLRTKPCPKPKK